MTDSASPKEGKEKPRSSGIRLHKPPQSSGSATGKSRQVEDFCLTYGGMWKEFYEEIRDLKASNAALTEALQVKTQELELMHFAQEELQVQFKESLLSLTEAEGEHTELKEIFAQIESEKEALKSRLLGLDDHLDWVKRQNLDLQQMVSHWKEQSESLRRLCDERESSINNLHRMNDELCAEVHARDERIADLERKLASVEGEKRIVQTSLSQKCKQVSALVKERNQLREDLLQAIASAAPGRRMDQIKERNKTESKVLTGKTKKQQQEQTHTPSSSPTKARPSPPHTPTDLRGLIEAISPAPVPGQENNNNNPWARPVMLARPLSARKSSTPVQQRKKTADSAL